MTHTRSGPGWHLLQADYRDTCAHVAEQGGFIGGDLFARQEDGVPWVEVAAKVLTDRQRQQGLFR